jgi:hypothetical protein
MTPCNPSKPGKACALCTRHQPSLPDDPDRRPHTVVMDASALMPASECAFFNGHRVAAAAAVRRVGRVSMPSQVCA